MSGDQLRRLIGTFSDIAASGAKIELRAGTVSLAPDPGDGTARAWLVYSGGNPVTAIWNTNLIPYDGAQCVLALQTIGNTSLYYVLAIVDTIPSRSGTATVTAFTAGSATCTVTQFGNVYTAQRAAGYTPAVNDVAIVQDMGGQLYAVCALTVFTPPPPPPAPKVVVTPTAPVVGKTVYGQSTITAQDSGTWTTGYNWNSYFAHNVYSGSGYVPPSSGSWFYNGATKGLAGKTIQSIGFYLPARINAGSYNSVAAVHFYAHNAVSRGSGEPTMVGSATTINIPAHWGGGWLPLPTSMGSTLKAGGGISIAGDPYVGFVGVQQGNSGALSVKWSKP